MSNHSHGQPHSDSHHAIPQWKLIMVFFILVGLMVATIWASYLEGIPTIWMNAIALSIAVTKATFVIVVFMGVGYSTRLVKLFAYGGFAWFLLMFIMLADYMTRPAEAVIGWEKEQATALPRNSAVKPD